MSTASNAPRIDSVFYPLSQEKREYRHSILSSWVADSLVFGGIGLLLYAFLPSGVLASIQQEKFARTGLLLSYLVNLPHFLASYFILYVERRNDIFVKPRLFFAGIIVPLVICSAFFVGLYFGITRIFSALISIMFLSVGWHYAKQAFGVICLSQRKAGHSLGSRSKQLLKFNLLLLAALTSVAYNQSQGIRYFDLIGYASLEFPSWMVFLTKHLFSLTLGAIIVSALLHVWHRKFLISFTSIATYLSNIFWLVPPFFSSAFFQFVPTLHSLQYLGVVLPLKAKSISREMGAGDGLPLWKAFLFSKSGLAYLAFIFGGVAVLYLVLPSVLNRVFSQTVTMFGSGGTEIMVGAAISLHHYFVDNAIWRSDNRLFSEFSSPAKKSSFSA